jgi:hypothetical protein
MMPLKPSIVQSFYETPWDEDNKSENLKQYKGLPEEKAERLIRLA